MEADLKIQAATAVGMLRTAALARSAFDYIGDALRAVQDVVSTLTSESEEKLETAVEQLTSIHHGPAIHSITLASREVQELHMSADAAIRIISRWFEHNQTGLPATAWRVRGNELVAAVVHARKMLEQAAAWCHRASVVLDVAIMAWSNFPSPLRNAWMMDGRRSLISARDYLNLARDSLTKACAAAVGARDAAKLLVDLL